MMMPVQTLLCAIVFFCVNFFHINGERVTASQNLRSQNDATVHVVVDDTIDSVEITLTVVSNRWVGCGFGSTTMPDTYSINAYDTTTVQERVLASNAQGSALSSPTITVLNDTIANNLRTIVVNRTINPGGDAYDFTGIVDGSQLAIIWGVGSSTNWAKHQNRGDKILRFAAPTSSPTGIPSIEPTAQPSMSPTGTTISPTQIPSGAPTYMPTGDPTAPSDAPTNHPTQNDTIAPTLIPSANPTAPSDSPSSLPTTMPSRTPSTIPSSAPTNQPTIAVEASVSYESNPGAPHNLTCEVLIYEEDNNFGLMRLTGPGNQWLGFGFGQTAMDGGYSVIIDGYGNVTERVLGHWTGGDLLTGTDNQGIFDSNITLNEIVDGIRTMEIEFDTRDLYYDFSILVSSSNGDAFGMMLATNETEKFGQHSWQQHGEASIETSMTREPTTTGEVADVYTVTQELDALGMAFTLTQNSSHMTIELTGPSDRWFACAWGGHFNGDAIMYTTGVNGTYAYDGHLSDKDTGSSGNGVDSQNDWTVQSLNEDDGKVTFVATRPLETDDSEDNDFEFPPQGASPFFFHLFFLSFCLIWYESNKLKIPLCCFVFFFFLCMTDTKN